MGCILRKYIHRKRKHEAGDLGWGVYTEIRVLICTGVCGCGWVFVLEVYLIHFLLRIFHIVFPLDPFLFALFGIFLIFKKDKI